MNHSSTASTPDAPLSLAPDFAFAAKPSASTSTLLSTLSAAADTYSQLGLTSSSRFFAEHAAALTPSPATVLRLARLHASAGHHRQALHILNSANLPPTDLSARLLAAQSLFALGQLEDCLSLLGDAHHHPDAAISGLSIHPPPHPSRQLHAALCVLRAAVYERQDNPSRAVLWYKRALRCDLFCVDAFDRLVHSGLVTPDDARAFIIDLTTTHLREKRDPAATWLAAYYLASVDRTAPLPTAPSTLQATVDLRHLSARRAYDGLRYASCASICRAVLNDQHHLPQDVMLTYLASLVALDERHDLFVTAHLLVDRQPKAALSWLAVAYYYFASGKPDVARRFFRKATALDSRLAPAWVALGHAYAVQDESDQAMAAYRTATRLFPGAQLPSLFMGMEYARQGSLAHATLLFESASRAMTADPAPPHELGVVAYRLGDLPRAVKAFRRALELTHAIDSPNVDGEDNKDNSVLSANGPGAPAGRRADAEEATLLNLGHCYRRLRQFTLARRCYERALALRPRAPATCTALAMTLHADGRLHDAVDMYHRALRDHPADPVCVELLDRALWDQFNAGNDYVEAPLSHTASLSGADTRWIDNGRNPLATGVAGTANDAESALRAFNQDDDSLFEAYNKNS